MPAHWLSSLSHKKSPSYTDTDWKNKRIKYIFIRSTEWLKCDEVWRRHWVIKLYAFGPSISWGTRIADCIHSFVFGGFLILANPANIHRKYWHNLTSESTRALPRTTLFSRPVWLNHALLMTTVCSRRKFFQLKLTAHIFNWPEVNSRRTHCYSACVFFYLTILQLFLQRRADRAFKLCLREKPP